MNTSRAAGAALLLAATCAWAQAPLRLKARAGAAEVPARGSRPGTPRGNHYILQFPGFPDATVRAELVRRGIRVLQYVPDNALMVSSSPSADLNGLPLEWAGALEASDKISPVLTGQVSGAILAIFHADVSLPRAREIVLSLGFDIVPNAGLLPGQLVLNGPIDRLPELARFDEVAYLLPASPDLAAGVPVAGCAGALTEAGSIGEYVLVGNGWPKDAVGSVAIQYFIRSLTDKIDPNAARVEIQRALAEWTRYANVSISPGQQGAARTIDILFGRGAHGDAYPFDGPGGTLAHTFYPAPPNSEPLAGDMHFDGDENWQIGANIDLFSVALHEAGHAFGLGHSDRPGSVMYPYYHMVTGLSDDDIAGIRALYGSAAATAPVTPTATTPTTPTVTPPVTPPVTPAGTDTTPPTLQILSPAFTIVSTTGASIAISGIASDDIGVVSVKWSTSSGQSGDASGGKSWSATVPLLNGTNVVTVRAYDAAGNSGWRSITVVRR
jgi:Matrixin/Glucodextranase, domain B